MSVQRSIRCMTPQEIQAKREWGTGACQVRGCATRAAYLAMESAGQAAEGDWWQYQCARHARSFANEHGLELPAGPARAARSLAAP